MFIMWIVPLLLILLLVYAITGNNFANIFKPVTSRACPNCGKPTQTDWKTCPQCGQSL